jgi:hypothetical protein
LHHVHVFMLQPIYILHQVLVCFFQEWAWHINPCIPTPEKKNCMYVCMRKKTYVCRQTKNTQWSILIKCWIYTSWFGIFFGLMLYAWWRVGWHRKKNTQDTFSMEEQWEIFLNGKK